MDIYPLLARARYYKYCFVYYQMKTYEDGMDLLIINSWSVILFMANLFIYFLRF